VFRHQARRGASGEVSGHYHPKARVATRAGEIVRPCFIADASRLILPSFGAYTGGLDVRNPAIANLFPGGAEAFLLGRAQLFRFAVPAPARQAVAAQPAEHRFI
jgi:metallophosphoesterase superfamily enzyme